MIVAECWIDDSGALVDSRMIVVERWILVIMTVVNRVMVVEW